MLPQLPVSPQVSETVSCPRTIVVGLGNEIAGDDGVGIWTARKLGGLLAADLDVEVVCLPWGGFALLDVLVGKQKAAIIDCLCTGVHPPGAIVRLQENDLRGSVRLNSFHDINYPTAVAFGRRLGWSLPNSIAIWGIEGQVTNQFREGLSPPVRNAVDRVVSEVLSFLGVSSPVAGDTNMSCGNDSTVQNRENYDVCTVRSITREFVSR